ncbi:LPXTG cell wall anchor domain-containing protein [Staphylococcus pettenkoferi]|uniref:LPXTG cell wall anchor domain-containing protein n=1 Tax=Staphylococcus pettenkoferi TaxID=170573 RepID=UPI00066BBC92|nr:LPXTG cell wall anchor domain-containing protein [Staphylococcus pettenkoferi]MCY1585304.1 LPXTG cell wall anchor domain-containing protein [Staphylococcus pettenkoferi]QQC38354.1 LPXTG cell wall anchor domain-containing protein [Staphylococcus pettenkoferi]UIK48964.1 LPXTG cell wall anchor domain-containing protein [Staphylococcus pettenkoferi]
MKKLGITSATVLTGALIFGGAGAHEVHAANYDAVTKDNATDIAIQIGAENNHNASEKNFLEPKDEGDYIEVPAANKSMHGSADYHVYKNGDVKYRYGAVEDFKKIGHYDLAEKKDSNGQNGAAQDTQNNDGQAAADNKQNSGKQAAGEAQQNQSVNQSANDGTVQQNAKQQQDQQKVNSLPDTGKETSGMTITAIALLMTGLSLISFRKRKDA